MTGKFYNMMSGFFFTEEFKILKENTLQIIQLISFISRPKVVNIGSDGRRKPKLFAIF